MSKPVITTLELTNGEFVVLDYHDYLYLRHWTWWKNAQGYAVRSVGTPPNERHIRMHRVIAERAGMNIKGLLVDHKDRNTLNNCRRNLRPATKSDNGHNRGPSSNNTSGCKGVYWDDRVGRYRSQICINRKRVHLGYFKSLRSADRAYKQAARHLKGEFAAA